jgi:hypothetical protein
VLIASLAGLGLALFGIAMTMSGVFPLLNPLHYGFGLMLAGILAPFFGALAFRNGGGLGQPCRSAFRRASMRDAEL